tara:strand:+ start:292 stop:837 length:546 start_codon:yes stop_codon:yes gene_type:complete
MHRNEFIQQLEAYRQRWGEEKEVCDQFIEFISGNADCFERSFKEGHVTASAWVVNGEGSHVLLTHHRKLNRWLQLGGHVDGESDVLEGALREVEEESGLTEVRVLGEGIFDLDIHPIPARGDEPEHMHYDVRYLCQATGNEEFVVSDESHDLAWVKMGEVVKLANEESMLRMVRKCAGNVG